MLRIAVYHNLPSGGAKRTLYDQVKRLCKNHIVDVYSLSCSEHRFADLRPFVNNHIVFPYESSSLLRKPFRRLNQVIRLIDLKRLERLNLLVARDINTKDYDVIYVQPCQFLNSPPLLHYLQKPSVFYCHETLRIVYDTPIQSRTPSRNSIKQFIDKLDPLPPLYLRCLAKEDKRNIRSAKRVLVNSKYSQDQLTHAYQICSQVCYHGVDTTVFHPMNLEREQYVISVGALRANKGFDFIIQSLALISSDRRPSFVLVTNYQDPQELSYLSQLAQASGVKLDIRVLVSDEELVLLYNRALITLYTPLQEPFGLVPLESMACGTPVIGLSEGGVIESISDGINGLLSERYTQAFSQAILSLLNDPKRLDRLGQQGRTDILENWSWDIAILRLENKLTEVASS